MAQRRAARGLGADIVGTSVEVFWSGDATWYRGVVSEYDAVTGMHHAVTGLHHVVYDVRQQVRASAGRANRSL